MSSPLTPNQEVFSSSLAKLTGLNANVLRGWTLAEESGGAARQRAAQANNNWLNVGYFDSGPGGLTKSQQWATPQAAAKATALFLEGKQWGASPGIRGILNTKALTPQQQIAAIAKSGWASSGYNGGKNLLATYGLVSGTPVESGSLQTAALPTTPAPATDTGTTGPIYGRTKAQTVMGILNAKDPAAALGQFQAGQPRLNVTASPSVAATGVSPNAPAAIKLAEQYLGTPYKWGGSSPKTGFDCSGLLQYVWAKQGVSIPRTTYQQVKAGVEVPVNQLQPGDALFFGSHNAPHHVGMYIGHGQFIEAPHTGADVRISNLSDRMGDFAQARRFS